MTKPLSLLILVLLISSVGLSQYPGSGFYGQNMMMPGMMGVPGAYPTYDPGMSAAGSGQMMLNQCAYPQRTLPDPLLKDEHVKEIAKKIKDTDKKLADAKSKRDEISEDFDAIKEKLEKALSKGGKYSNADDFLAIAEECRNISSQAAGQDAGTWGQTVVKNKAFSNDERVDCYNASYTEASRNVGPFQAANLCVSQEEHIPNSPPNDKYLLVGGVNVKSGVDQQNCGTNLERALGLKKQLEDADQKISDLEDAKKDADREDQRARKAAQKKIDDEKESRTAKTVGIIDCDHCGEQTGPGTGTKLALAGIGSGLSAFSIWSEFALKKRQQDMGFVVNPQVSNSNLIAGGMVSGFQPIMPFMGMGGQQQGYGAYPPYGMNSGAGYPFMSQGLYGQTPGGYSNGGYGCAPTMNGSQFGMPQGPFQNGPFNGAYGPGGYGMPGMGPWGVGGMPGMPGANMYQNFGLQQQLAMQQQQLAMLNAQAQNQQRAQIAAMAAMQAGLASANQGFGVAQSQLMGSQYGQFGGSQYGGMAGGQFGGGQFGQFGGGQFGGQQQGLYSGMFSGQYAQSQCGGGNPFARTSISICGNIPLGGGSYQPTFSNGGYPPYGGGSPYGGGTSFGTSGYIR